MPEQKMIIRNMTLLSAITPIEGESNKFEKQILPYGKITHPQNPKIKVDFNDEIFDGIIKAFNDNVIETVAILSGTHDDGELDSTVGAIISVYKKDAGLYVALEVLDQDTLNLITTKKKDGNSLLSGVSASLGKTVSSDGVKYPHVLFHVALTHQPHITGMEGFIKLFKNKDEDYFYLGDYAKSLDQKSYTIRRAFYNKNKCNCSYTCSCENRYYYIKDVYDDFIIVIDESSNNLIKFDYNVSDDGNINFESPIVVEIEYVVVRETNVDMSNVTEQEVLNFFKENGFGNVDSIEYFKKLETSKDEEMTNLRLEKDKEIEVIKATLTSEQTEKVDLIKRVEVLEVNKVSMEAEKLVDREINLGKILPAQKQTYINLYKVDSDIFDVLMKDQPVVVDTSQHGYDSTTSDKASDFDMDAQQVQENIAKYGKMSTMNRKVD